MICWICRAKAPFGDRDVRWRPTIEDAAREDPDMATMLSHEYSPNKCLGHVAVYTV